MHNITSIFQFLKNRELNELYASIAFRSIAIAMISVFIPIFLIQTGYSLKQVFLFYIIFSIFRIPTSIYAGKIVTQFGFKHSILYSVPAMIIFFLLLYSLPTFNWSFWLVAFFGALANSLFWVGYHVDFSKFSEKGKRNKEIGISNMIILLLKSLGPITGGLILSVMGFQFLFVLVSILLFVSVIPLFFSDEVYEPITYSIKKLFLDINLRKFLGASAQGINSTIGFVLWPVYVFLFIINKSYIALGSITSVAFFIALLTTFIVGRFSDKKSKTVLLTGSIFNSFLHLLRLFVKTVLGVYLLNSFFRIGSIFISIPFDSRNYATGVKHKNIIESIVLRESIISFGKLLFFILLYFTQNFFIGFITGAIVSPLIAFF